ncbi:MAG: pantoate--beta-alanine ligase [Mariprofundaceae bacterium]|nr:pantoate--beta-alanine ligase [Mariprofundaceae bacterium]
MKIIRTATGIRRTLAGARGHDRIALVPTMGCLHEGHLSLIRQARRLADIVVVSIYVNPLQFGPGEDLDRYPRTFDKDRAACETGGVDFIFHPRNLYPVGGPKLTLRIRQIGEILCGASRPGHFDGVATVVNILFNIVQPDIAVFGEKDYQQLVIIRRMVADLAMPVEIISGKTVREADGLAMSSRNRYLAPEDRRRAAALYASLQLMAEHAQKGEKNCVKLLKTGENHLRAHGIEPEYLEIRQAGTLAPIRRLGEKPCRAFVAARLGPARLIDNIKLG